MPSTSPLRTHVRVARSDGREWPSMFVAYRELLGTREELGYSEHQRMRAQLRRGASVRDRHGFTWRALTGVVTAVPSSVSEQRPIAAAVSSAYLWSDFTFGCELEIAAPLSMYDLRAKLDRAGFSGWKVVHDGSVQGSVGASNGMEVVSPILKGEEGLTALRNVCMMLKSLGCKVNSSCGFHVHVGVRGMTAERLRKIAIAFLNAEHHFDALVPPSRLSNRYCQSNRARTGTNSWQNLISASSVSVIANAVNGGNSPQRYNHYRYHKLNLQSYLQHGTIEFRQHNGTVEADKAANWVRLILGFCANAVNGAQQARGQAQSFAEFLSACTDEAGVRYMTARAARFSAARQRQAA